MCIPNSQQQIQENNKTLAWKNKTNKLLALASWNARGVPCGPSASSTPCKTTRSTTSFESKAQSCGSSSQKKTSFQSCDNVLMIRMGYSNWMIIVNNMWQYSNYSRVNVIFNWITTYQKPQYDIVHKIWYSGIRLNWDDAKKTSSHH